MQRVIAAMMLAWLGILFPLSGASASWCMLESRLLVGKAECHVEQASCPKCHGAKKDQCAKKGEDKPGKPCCVELNDLPDVAPPAIPDGLPVIAAIDLPAPVFVLPPAVLVEASIYEAAAPIRGPDSPAAWRARLEVWRL